MPVACLSVIPSCQWPTCLWFFWLSHQKQSTAALCHLILVKCICGLNIHLRSFMMHSVSCFFARHFVMATSLRFWLVCEWQVLHTCCYQYWQVLHTCWPVIGLWMTGIAHLLFPSSNNHYTWRKVTTTVNNIIVGRLWVDNHGEMDIKNHTTGDNCHLKFFAYSYFSREPPRKVTAKFQYCEFFTKCKNFTEENGM